LQKIEWQNYTAVSMNLILAFDKQTNIVNVVIIQPGNSYGFVILFFPSKNLR